MRLRWVGGPPCPRTEPKRSIRRPFPRARSITQRPIAPCRYPKHALVRARRRLPTRHRSHPMLKGARSMRRPRLVIGSLAIRQTERLLPIERPCIRSSFLRKAILWIALTHWARALRLVMKRSVKKRYDRTEYRFYRQQAQINWRTAKSGILRHI